MIIAKKRKYSNMELNFSTEQENIYHYINRFGYGNHYLVAKSNFHTTSFETYTKIMNTEVTMQMNVAEFMLSLSRNQREKFCHIIALLENSIVRNFIDTHLNNINTNSRYTLIPNCHKQARYTYIEGSNALLQNLPNPVPKALSDNHSYVSLRDIIAYYLALDIPIHYLWSDEYNFNNKMEYSNFYESPMVHSIMTNVKKCMEKKEF